MTEAVYKNPWGRPPGNPRELERELVESITPILAQYRGSGGMSKDRISGIADGAL